MIFSTHRKRDKVFFCPNKTLLAIGLTIAAVLLVNFRLWAIGSSRSRVTLAIRSADIITATAGSVNDIPITGKVVDETGQPLIGVTIKIKGVATGGVATDINGAFHITAPEKAVLVVSYISYETQEVAVEGQKTLTITLKSASKSLSEVVIIGYGSQKKTDVTGAVASISGESLQAVPAQANISESLQGRIPGLDISSTGNTPGAGNQIRLRGERSFGRNSAEADATNGPLFVLDGVPFINGSLNDINPDDIASIDVLKDASATAIYGSRASGGVILVTTKRGKNGRVTVNFNTTTGVSSAVGHYNIMNAEQYIAFKKETIAGNSTSPGTTSYPITVAEQAGINTAQIPIG